MKCPRCEAKLPFTSIRARFTCPNCGTPLSPRWFILTNAAAAVLFFLVSPFAVSTVCGGYKVFVCWIPLEAVLFFAVFYVAYLFLRFEKSL